MNWLKTPAQERKAKAARIAKADRRRIRKIKGIWPAEDEAYRDWIRSLPCVVCCVLLHGLDAYLMELKYRPQDFTAVLSQCAHVGPRGLRQKCSDHETAPLCGKHHDRGQPESHHTLGRGFWTYHGIAYNVLMAGLNSAWETITGHKIASGEDYA